MVKEEAFCIVKANKLSARAKIRKKKKEQLNELEQLKLNSFKSKKVKKERIVK